VSVDGRTAVLGDRADPESARIEIDGIPLPVAPELTYYLAYKPAGVVSTRSDPQGRPTVVELVPATPPVYPVGRLDADSEGLLILTNDGDLTQLLTHPSGEVPKTYTVLVAGEPDKQSLRRLTAGVVLDDGPAAALRARLIGRRRGEALVEIVMGEGRKREVRRMCDAIGHPVHRLIRTAIGPLRDADLRPGTWRALTLAEVRSLYAAAAEVHDDD
jgi:pseudouridine synthase